MPLLDKGANIHTQDNTGRTPLHYAAAGNHPQIVEYLIQRKKQQEQKISAKPFSNRQTSTKAATYSTIYSTIPQYNSTSPTL